MRKLCAILVVLAVAGRSVGLHSGAEDALEVIVQTYKALIEEVDKSFVRVTFYFDNLENYEGNQQLVTPVFADNLGYTIHTLLDFKETIYANLRKLATLSDEVAKKQRNFDTYLSAEHRNLLLFVTSLPPEATSPLLNKLFCDLKSQRSLLAVSCRDLRDSVQNCLINTVNLFDLLEEFVHDLSPSSPRRVFRGVTPDDVQRYGFILGFLTELRRLYQNHNSLLEKTNQALLGVDQYLRGFDQALDDLQFYYKKRFVKGMTDDELTESEPPLALKRKLPKRKKDAEQAHPVCDKLFMGNFGVEDGPALAFSVDPYDRLPFCPQITWSCCTASVLSETLAHFGTNVLPSLREIQQRTEQMVADFTDHYGDFTSFAYGLLTQDRLRPACEHRLRRLVFLPLNRGFFRDALRKLRALNRASLEAKAGVFCMVCDQSFQKQAMESGTVKLEQQFCGTFTRSALPFLRDFARALVDYINAVSEALQCDPDTGDWQEEFSLRLGLDPGLLAAVDHCQDDDDDFCEPLCRLFSFESAKTPLEIDATALESVHQFVFAKMALLNFSEMARKTSFKASLTAPEYTVQRESTLGFRSMNNLQWEFRGSLEEGSIPSPGVFGADIAKELLNEGV